MPKSSAADHSDPILLWSSFQLRDRVCHGVESSAAGAEQRCQVGQIHTIRNMSSIPLQYKAHKIMNSAFFTVVATVDNG
ncbi:hypothetical protein AC579_8004 [Pseudocercospora musae]|uniref:Uncharacterized protein n=1 Tax=Pseudocercospora musae TaxID=113226 RepID=A0A139I4J5_9PEZI|nr:hypothetical protein AC579_8004 [Pseudocercospora musae]